MMIPISVDAGVDQRLDPVEEHGLVGDRHQLLRRGVGDRAQARAGAAGEDQALQVAPCEAATLPRPAEVALQPTVYIPNSTAPHASAGACSSLAASRRRRGSTSSSSTTAPADGSVAAGCGSASRRSSCSRWSATSASAPALNRAVAERPGDPLILLNNDAECEPRFVEALLDAPRRRARSRSPGCWSRRRARSLIDSAGVVADAHPDGLRLPARRAGRGRGRRAADPLGPTGGAALYAPRGLRGGRRLRRADLPLLRGPRPGAAAARRAAAAAALAPEAPAAARLLGQPRRRQRREVRAAPAGAAATCCAATG